jgi:hypothetical protein
MSDLIKITQKEMFDAVFEYCSNHDCINYEIEFEDDFGLGRATQLPGGNCQIQSYCSGHQRDQPVVGHFLGSAYRKIINMEEKR